MPDIHGCLSGTTFDELPDDVVQHAKTSFLDTLGCIVAGSSHTHTRKLTEFVRSFEEVEEATVVARETRATSSHAAMVNGTMAYTVELDDVSPAHPGSVVVPAALSLAEKQGASGPELLAATALGYETIARIYLTAPETPENPYPGAFPNVRFDEVPIHKSSVVGAFGAAAAGATILGLDADGFADAFGNCAIAPVAPFEVCSSGGMVKPLSDAGFPSYAGVLAAQLAGRGFTGVDDILQADQGILKILLGEEFHYDRITEEFGETWLAKEYVSQQRHACCSGSHAHIDVIIDLLDDHPEITPESVESVTVWASDFAYNMMGTGDRTAPADVTAAKFSFPFVVATAITDGHVLGLDDFGEERIADADLLALARTVDVVRDERFEAFEGKVRIETAAGSYTGSRDGFRGRFTDRLTPAEIEEKFRRLASREYDDDRVDRIVGTVTDLESLDDAGELGRLLA